jgi:hypothetical protein
MKCLTIIALMFTVGCATSRGGLTLSSPFEDVAKCPKDRYIIYKEISASTSWDTQEQTVEYSWQCTKYGSVDGHDTYRTGKVIGTYKPPEPKDRPMREYPDRGRN